MSGDPSHCARGNDSAQVGAVLLDRGAVPVPGQADQPRGFRLRARMAFTRPTVVMTAVAAPAASGSIEFVMLESCAPATTQTVPKTYRKNERLRRKGMARGNVDETCTVGHRRRPARTRNASFTPLFTSAPRLPCRPA